MTDSLSAKNIIQIIRQFGPGMSMIGGAGIIMRSIALESLKYRAHAKVVVDSYSPIAQKNINFWNRDGLDVYQFPLLQSMPKGVHFLGRTYRKYIRAKVTFNRIAKLTKPDIVHLHMHPGGLLGLALEFKKRTKAKVIVTTHGLEPQFHNCGSYKNVPYFPKWIESVEAVDTWVPCGPVDHKGLLDWGIPENRIKPIYNGVEVPGTMPVIEDKKAEEGALRITYVGRMIGRKGIFDLREAMVKVAQKQRDKKFVLTMVGDYTQDTLRKLKENLEPLNGRLKYEFLGEMPNIDVKNILCASDIFCHPSKNPLEGLPLSILEAAACGCPMVLSHHYAHLAIYEPGVHAAFFKMANRDELAEAILDLVNDKEKRMNLRKNAYRLVKEKFNIKEMLKKYMSLYNDMLQTNKNTEGANPI